MMICNFYYKFWASLNQCLAMGYIRQYNESEKTKQENPCNVCIVSPVVYLQAHVGGVQYVALILLMTKLTHTPRHKTWFALYHLPDE